MIKKIRVAGSKYTIFSHNFFIRGDLEVTQMESGSAVFRTFYLYFN